MHSYTLLLAAFAALLAGCASLGLPQPGSLEDARMPTDVPAPFHLTMTMESEIASRIPPRTCPVDFEGILSFAAPKPYSTVAPWDGFFWYGSEYLWTALPDDGVWSALPKNPDGYTQKIMWWSIVFNLSAEPEPALVVTGRRLDGDSPPLRFYGATNAMAEDIGEAMLTGVEFPTLGCWEVVGQYKKTELKFVVWIAP